MLIGLMARLLSAHKGSVLAIVVLQLVQATANLLLPTLNAAIIDDGIIAATRRADCRLFRVSSLLASSKRRIS